MHITSTRPIKIPHFGLARQYQDHKEEFLAASDAALRTGQFDEGEFTKQFEDWLKQRTRARYAVTVNSGTQALEFIARYELTLNPDVTTIKIPNLTYPATMNAFITAGWKVEIADTDGHGIYHPVAEDEMACVVGLYGRALRQGYPCKFIVDAAQHWLVANKTFGCGMAVSFDPTKNLPSSGNGGAIITDNKSLYDFALRYRDQGGEDFKFVGTNSKMSEQDCAQTLVRTKYIDHWQIRRQEIAGFWNEEFEDLPVKCLCEVEKFDSRIIKPSSTHAYQKYVLYTAERNSLHTSMLLDGIESKIHYKYTLGELDEAKNRGLAKPDLMSVSMMLSRGVLSLPMYPELTDLEVEFIAERVRRHFNK